MQRAELSKAQLGAPTAHQPRRMTHWNVAVPGFPDQRPALLTGPPEGKGHKLPVGGGPGSQPVHQPHLYVPAWEGVGHPGRDTSAWPLWWEAGRAAAWRTGTPAKGATLAPASFSPCGLGQCFSPHARLESRKASQDGTWRSHAQCS